MILTMLQICASTFHPPSSIFLHLATPQSIYLIFYHVPLEKAQLHSGIPVVDLERPQTSRHRTASCCFELWNWLVRHREYIAATSLNPSKVGTKNTPSPPVIILSSRGVFCTFHWRQQDINQEVVLDLKPPCLPSRYHSIRHSSKGKRVGIPQPLFTDPTLPASACPALPLPCLPWQFHRLSNGLVLASATAAVTVPGRNFSSLAHLALVPEN